ncbi:sentrin-specific protease 2-like [Leucoraja erinacea]|uniref:sentrin-specific protease 2-like n=1 Tax=Leucoraja erinaceus TaxID=7782 RepID=UPI002457D155|nr:sentrin-specific protease 2-like [Leucoraja erinacea]
MGCYSCPLTTDRVKGLFVPGSSLPARACDHSDAWTRLEQCACAAHPPVSTATAGPNLACSGLAFATPMYQWIRGNFSSVFPTGSEPPPPAASERNVAGLLKRTYESVHTSNDEIEWKSVKRQKLDYFVKAVKKSLTGLVSYIKSVSPFGYKVMQVESKSSVQRKSNQQLKQELSSSLTDLCDSSSREPLSRVDLKLDVDQELGWRNHGNERKWQEFHRIRQRKLCEPSRETSELLPFPLQHRSLPSTPPPIRNDVRCGTLNQQSTEKNEKEQYKLLLRLVAAGLEKKSEEQPSISASKTTHVSASTNWAGYKEKQGSFENDPLSLRLGEVGRPMWRESCAKSTSGNINTSRQIHIDQHSEILENTGGKTALTIKALIEKQHIDQDLSQEVAVRLYLDEGDATAAVDLTTPQTLKENLSVLKKDQGGNLPQFTETMVEEVRKALDYGELDEVVSTGFKLKITRKDISTLCNYSWLNDEVINFYMCLIMERSKEAYFPGVYAFNTFFYLKLHTGGYQTVKQWTKGVDLFEKDLILVPVHLGVHWCLTVADLRKKLILHFDSMGQWNDDVCWTLLRYLQEESRNKKGHQLDSSKWVLRSMRSHEVPQQLNGSDCGVFVCKYADYIARDEKITFTQHDIPYFRMKMVWEILHKKLL